ncbi:MAG: hypothetical protein Q9193_007017 [Seirophora villosa]
MNGIQQAPETTNNNNSILSRISRPPFSSSTRSHFTILLHDFATSSSQPPNPEPLLTHLSSLSPSATDVEIRSLANLHEMTSFIHALTQRLRQKRDYELVQTWMSVFLRAHAGEIVAAQGKEEEEGEGEMQGLRAALREWREEQGREGKRLGELVGYCSGVLAWLRSAR